jgi:hypothetical protein
MKNAIAMTGKGKRLAPEDQNCEFAYLNMEAYFYQVESGEIGKNIQGKRWDDHERK